MEPYFLRAMKMSQGDIMVIFSSSIGNTLWIFLVISLALPYIMDRRRGKSEKIVANAPYA